MNIKIKKAFEPIKANEELKANTKAYILNSLSKTQKVQRTRFFTFSRMATICVSLIIMIFGAQWIYFTQTALISIDINPSIELGVNRFDRIISTKALNEDGQNILKNLNLFNKTTSEAVDEVLNDNEIIKLETENQIISITVSSKNQEQSEVLLNQMEHCTQGHTNTHCQSLSSEEANEAKTLGLSNGKYKEFLVLKEYDPTITAEEVSNMTMKEIRDRIDSYENSVETDSENQCNPSIETQSQNLHRGKGHHYGQNHE